MPKSDSTKSEAVLTEQSLNKLLNLLGGDRNSGAEEYERIRAKLIILFENNGCPTVSVEGLAVKTLDRLVAKVDQGEKIRSFPSFAMGIARNVTYEFRRETLTVEIDQNDGKQLATEDPPEIILREEEEDLQRRIDCLNNCLDKQPPQKQQLFKDYFSDKKLRKRQAKRLDLEPVALRVRAYRIREKMEDCVKSCMDVKLA